MVNDRNNRVCPVEIAGSLDNKIRRCIVEPLFHVSKKAFENTVRIAHDAGLTVVERPKMFLNKTAILKKGDSII
ncbi:MAG: hypothetical protein QM498_12965 [Desulfobacterium sp.]